MTSNAAAVVVVDYGMGNLFSVKNACERVGMKTVITSSRKEIEAANAVILPGVGAFGDAMTALRDRDLVDVLRDAAASGKPLVGICLGMHLLLSEGYEFGRHEGLNIVDGCVVRFDCPMQGDGKILKIPEVQWNRICKIGEEGKTRSWAGTLLDGVPEGKFMYFVHSYIAVPTDETCVLSTSRYGHISYCSTLARGNIFACQYHPERSGEGGLKIYRNLAAQIARSDPFHRGEIL